MAEKMSNLAQNLLTGLKEAIDYVEEKPNECHTTIYIFADAKAIRKSLGISQNEFSSLYGIPLSTLQNWEQGRTRPDRTASSYLWAIEELPQQIRKVQQHHQNSSSSLSATM